MNLDQIKPGDILAYWHDTGALGPSRHYVRVLCVGAKMVRVRGEQGVEVWKRPEFFADKVSANEAAALRADGMQL